MGIYSIKAKNMKGLMRRDGVVSVGIGNKTVNGRETGPLSIIVGVRKKRALGELNKRDIVPNQVKGYLTDVVEVGEIKALSYTDRMRPAQPGCSIGHYQVTSGTFGAVVIDNDTNEKLILSNNHVLANVNEGETGDPILQPGTYYSGTVESDTLGLMKRFIEIVAGQYSSCNIAGAVVSLFNKLADLLNRKTRLYAYLEVANKVDCAVASVLNEADISNEIIGYGIPTGIDEVSLGDTVDKVGSTSERTTEKVNQINYSCWVNMGDGRMALFDDQIAVSGNFSEPGDSGSLVLKGDKAVGLLFAGGEGITVVSRIQNVLSALNVTLQT